jgi:cytoskeletal protein RodZ
MGQLGDTLKERRMALGISLEQAEEDTKIRARLLAALEDGEYSRLPNPGYVRGYVSSYARYLELDPVPLLAMHRAETGSGRFHDLNIPDETVPARHEQHAVPWRVGIIAFAIVAVVAAGSWVTWRYVRGPQKPPPIPTAGSQTGAPATVPTTSFALKVTAVPNGASAVKVTVDGSQAYNGTLTAGQTQSFQVTTAAVLKIAKPTQVTVERDGKKVALPTGTNVTLSLNAATP